MADRPNTFAPNSSPDEISLYVSGGELDWNVDALEIACCRTVLPLIFFFLLAGLFGGEIPEGRSIYSLLSFGTTPGMFLGCFLISSFFSAGETMIYAGFAHTTGPFAASRQNGAAARM